MTEDDLKRAERDTEAAARRGADQTMRDALAEAGFRGDDYDRWKEMMAAYGLSVMSAWIYSGQVFDLVKAHGRPVAATSELRMHLANSSESRSDLAGMTIARTFPWFRSNALLNGRWEAQQGASLPTFFMTAALWQFPNVFRSWHSEQKRYQRFPLIPADETAPDQAASRHYNTEAMALGGQQAVQSVLARFPARTQQILTYTVQGYSQEEIAELIGASSARAVEGVLRRARKTLGDEYPGWGGQR